MPENAAIEHDLGPDPSEPLYRFLTKRLHLNMWSTLIIVIGINLIRTIAIPWLHHDANGGNLFTDPGIKDIQAMLISFIVHPILVITYWRSATAIPNAYKKLLDNDVIKPADSADIDEFFRVQIDKTASKGIKRLWLVLIILVLIGFNLSWRGSDDPTRYPPYGAYPYHTWQSLLIETPYGFFTISFAMWAVWRGLVFAESIRKLWKHHQINVHPYARDHAGGLGVIGEITLLAGLLAGGLSLFVSASFWANKQNPDDLVIVLVMFVLMLLIAPFAFYALIWPTHRRMKEAKTKRLNTIREQLQDYWEPLATGAKPLDESQANQMLSLVEIRNTIEHDYPIWPFPRSLGVFLIRYMVRVVAPLVLTQFIPGIDLLFGLINIG